MGINAQKCIWTNQLTIVLLAAKEKHTSTRLTATTQRLIEIHSCRYYDKCALTAVSFCSLSHTTAACAWGVAAWYLHPAYWPTWCHPGHQPELGVQVHKTSTKRSVALWEMSHPVFLESLANSSMNNIELHRSLNKPGEFSLPVNT